MFKFKRMIYIVVLLLIAIIVAVMGYMQLPKFGGNLSVERLARVEQSPNYRDGSFRNLEHTPQLTSDKSRVRVMWDFLFEKRENNRPKGVVPAIKSDLRGLDRASDIMVWFGHSSYFLQLEGLRILVDPVFEDAAPLGIFNRPFAGTQIYKADDMPDLDMLIITHDHWDHLDHTTVMALRKGVQRVICPLGVGAHLERWGYANEQIVEMDWGDRHTHDGPLQVHCLPSRHFSGRGIRTNQTLWASFMLVGQRRTIYLSGDGGYGVHFAKIAQQFPQIDLAIMENGQYNADWQHIHLMPEDLLKATSELRAKRVFAGHNSKYALAKHPWIEPLDRAMKIEQLISPRIGEVVELGALDLTFERWWSDLN